MRLKLLRYYTPTETQGILTAGSLRLATLERPWIPDPLHNGGLSFESCVPEGLYKLVQHFRPTGELCLALVNSDNNVYHYEPNWGHGRYLILIHAANYAHEVVGCIAPGLARTIYNNRVMVTSSREAMRRLHSVVDFDRDHTLLIEQYRPDGRNTK